MEYGIFHYAYVCPGIVYTIKSTSLYLLSLVQGKHHSLNYRKIKSLIRARMTRNDTYLNLL